MNLASLPTSRSPICGECHLFYDRAERCAKQLACGHTVCEKCISQEDAEYPKVIKCPTCKVKHTTVSSSVPVDNEAVMKLVDVVPRCATHSSCYITFCLTCHEALCKKCSTEAMSNQKHSGHELEDYKDGMIAIQKRLQKSLNGVKGVYDRHVKSVLQAVRSAAEKDADNFSASIRTNGDEAIEYIRAWMKRSLQTVEDTASSNTRLLTGAEKPLCSQVDDITAEVTRIGDKLNALMDKDKVASAQRDCDQAKVTMKNYEVPLCMSHTFKTYQLELPDMSERNLVWSPSK